MKRQFRIIYTVVEPLTSSSSSLRNAEKMMESIADDLDEYCSGAISSSNVTAVLQELVTFNYLGNKVKVWVDRTGPNAGNLSIKA